MRILPLVVAASLVFTFLPLTSAEDVAAAPSLVSFEWLPREADAGGAALRFALDVDAPHGLVGGRVVAKSGTHHDVVPLELEPLVPGAHRVEAGFRVPDAGSLHFAWELTDVVLDGADGTSVAYALCDLIAIAETREPDLPKAGGGPRVVTVCVHEPTWVVVTFRAEREGATAFVLGHGVFTRSGSAFGFGHVLQDASGARVTNGAGFYSTASGAVGDSVTLRAGDAEVVVGESSGEVEARLNYGIGSLPRAVPTGETFDWGFYHVHKGLAPEDARLELFGEGIEVLQVRVGHEARLFTTEDFGHALEAKSYSTRSGALAAGVVRDETVWSTSGYFRVIGSAPFGTTVVGPDGPTAANDFYSATPGGYEYHVNAGFATRFPPIVLLSVADMPLVPSPPELT